MHQDQPRQIADRIDLAQWEDERRRACRRWAAARRLERRDALRVPWHLKRAPWGGTWQGIALALLWVVAIILLAGLAGGLDRGVMR